MRYAILAVGLGIQSAAWAVAPLVKPPLYREGEILVRYTDSALPADRQRSAEALGMVVKRSIADGRIALLRTPLTMTQAQAIAALRTRPEVRSAEPNYLRFPQSFTPNDPLFDQQWGLDNTGQADFISGETAGVAGADMGLTNTWDSDANGTPDHTGSGNVTVAIIDDGFELDHPDLAANFIAGYDFVHNTSNPSPDSSSDTHGTEVAGTIGAIGNNGTGVAGPIWNVKLMPLKFGMDVATEIDAMEYARTHQAQIVNFSYSGPTYSQAEADEISALNDAGILFVTAAGNGGSNIDISGAVYPALYHLPNEVVVSAMDRRGAVPSFSNYGPVAVDVAAPGEEIVTTTTSKGYTTSPGISGSSLAAGYTSGMSALLIDSYASPSIADLRGALVEKNGASPLLAYTAGASVIVGALPATNGVFVDAPSFRIQPIQVSSYSQGSGSSAVTVPITQPYRIIDDSDGNGLLDPGETAALQLTIDNRWHDASNVFQSLTNNVPGNPVNLPIATTQVIAAFSLPTSDAPATVTPFDPTDPLTYNETVSVTVYDSLGATHNLGFYLARDQTPQGAVSPDWTLYSVFDGDTTQLTSTNLAFDAGGALIQPAGGFIELTAFNTTDGSDQLNLALDLSGTTETPAPFSLLQFSQNGYTTGEVGPYAIVNTNPLTLGDLPSQASSTATYNLSIPSTVSGHQYVHFTLATWTFCPPPIGICIPYDDFRSFVIELGTLTNNVPVTQAIGTDAQDNFHTWHFTLDGTLPDGQDTLTFQTSATNDIDILVGYQSPVQYSIDLNNETAPGLTPAPGLYYTNVPDTQTGAAPGGNEYVNIPNPQPGNYFVTVVNHDRAQNASYTLAAFTSKGGVGSAASSTIAYQQSSGTSSGSGAFAPFTLLALSALAAVRRRRTPC